MTLPGRKLIRPALVLAAMALLLLAVGFALQTATTHRAARPALTTGQPTAGSVKTPAAGMAGLLPPGALLTIESPDFNGLLGSWTRSPESAAWLASANYENFSNSRLFSRLSDAQAEFASTAGLAEAGTTFLQSVAGRESIFAWYDIGNLEFLYITRMSPAQAARTSLMSQRTKFSRRQAGANVFYVRTKPGSGSAGGPASDRTVAFATAGDLLLLATREDLMAGALNLLSHGAAPSVAAEPWYAEATAAAAPTSPAPAPDMHMVLNLDRLVPSSYFRSYWVQQNVTEMKDYRAAVADLYREPTRFREERTLLPKTSPAISAADPDLAPLAALAPPGTGLFRATATSDAVAAVKALDERLFGREIVVESTETEAPSADLTPAASGDTEDLETRIDTPDPVPVSASTDALRALLRGSGLQAVMTVDSAALPVNPGSLWVPIHAAVVLETERPLDPAALAPAIQNALRGTLTTANLGIELRPVASEAGIFALSGPRALFLAVSGRLCLLSDDQAMLKAMLGRVGGSAQAAPVAAIYLARFDHTTQRAPFARLTALVENAPAAGSHNGVASDSHEAPPYFSGNLKSLSDSFTALAAEQMTTRHQGETVHQTVLYEWGGK